MQHEREEVGHLSDNRCRSSGVRECVRVGNARAAQGRERGDGHESAEVPVNALGIIVVSVREQSGRIRRPSTCDLGSLRIRRAGSS